MPSAAPVRYLLPSRPGRVVLPRAASGAASPRPLAFWGSAAPPSLPVLGDVGDVEGMAAARRRRPRWLLRSAAGVVGVAVVVLCGAAWMHLQGQLASTRAELRAARRQMLVVQALQQQRNADRARRVEAALASLRGEASGLTAHQAHAGTALARLEATQRALEGRLSAAEAELKRQSSLGPAGGGSGESAFQRIYAGARRAVLYIRTTYRVRLSDSGDEQELTASGTGFLVSADGVAMTARHVLYPWRYDRKLMASQAMGLLKVEPDSVAISVWMAGSQVTDGTGDNAPFLLSDAFRRDAKRAQVRLLYVGGGDEQHESVMTSVGPAAVSMPSLSKGDVAVFQLVDPGRRFPHLTLERRPALAALDSVLVVGFPLARLLNGRAVPQATEGRVRRVGGSMLELDAALHPGSSGGPVLDRTGRVVGMASAILDSPVYGLALPDAALQAAWQATQMRLAGTRGRSLRLD